MSDGTAIFNVAGLTRTRRYVEDHEPQRFVWEVHKELGVTSVSVENGP